jgi:hypothetical protein
MRDNEFTRILDWPGYRVFRHEIDETAKTLRLWVRRKRGNRKLICSGCGRKFTNAHDDYQREVRDLPWRKYRTTVIIELYRVCCPQCGVRVEKAPRAVNRALRKAYGIGLCSVEESGAFSTRGLPPFLRRQMDRLPQGSHGSNGSGNGQPRLRDQLCLLIRQYNLDANLVKSYAAEFCGTEALSGASRELVESFISHLSEAAKENRDALVCKLNSYAQPVEAQP